jgi:hypothetical protein
MSSADGVPNAGVLIWLHEDSLSSNDPALRAWPDAPAVFVLDDAVLAEEQYSLKRVAFLYESAVETPAQIWRGDTVDTLLHVAGVHRATRIVTTESVNPRFGERVARLRPRLPVEVIEADAFVPRTLQTDLRRFSRFWKKAEPYAFGTKEG